MKTYSEIKSKELKITKNLSTKWIKIRLKSAKLSKYIIDSKIYFVVSLLVVLFPLVEILKVSKDPLFHILLFLSVHFVFYKITINKIFKPLNSELDLQIRALEEIYDSRIK